ncbi:hypothetical protein ABPG74_013680 [Tetrahymena malaccensis]
MGCCSSKQRSSDSNNTSAQKTQNHSNQKKKQQKSQNTEEKCKQYQCENEQIGALNNYENQNLENEQIADLNNYENQYQDNISIKQKHLKNQNSITSFTKVVRKLTYEQNGTLQTLEQEEIFQLPENINQLMSDRNIQNASYELKISFLGHNSNSNQTKGMQYKEMISLNNFSKIEIKKFVDENLNFDDVDFKTLKYSKQFNQFRQYQYFKQKEQKNKYAIKSQEAEESEIIESLMLQKVQESRYDLQECAQEITLLALKKAYEQKGINLVFKQSQQKEEPEQMNNNTMMSQQIQQIQEQVDEYDDIQRHLTQTGFDLETYFQIRLENDADNWNYKSAETNKECFAKYFKSEIRKKYTNLKDDDITILSIQEGSIIVDFMCPEHIDSIQIGDQYFDKVPVKYIVSELQITEDYFNPDYNMIWEKTDEKFYRGNINGDEQEYHLPVGYVGLGLNVLDNGIYPNDGWLNSDNSDATWIVLFHSTYPECVDKILKEGFKPGIRQAFQNYQCRFGRGQIGTGVYFSNKIERCQDFGGLIQVGDKFYRLIFQCRVNPKTIKSPENEQEYYICNDPKDARPYRILIQECVCDDESQNQS